MAAARGREELNQRNLRELRERYTRAVIEGDERQCGQLVEEALALGIKPLRVYLDLLIQSQIDVGEKWHNKEINVAVEHQATQITFSLINSLRSLLHPLRKFPFRAAVTSVEGEQHIIGLRLVADILYLHGWEVLFLGPSTPGGDLQEFVKEREVDLVALSLTLPENQKGLTTTIKKLKAIEKPPRIIVGGSALEALSLSAEDIGADAIVNNVVVLPQIARSLVGASEENLSVEDYLKVLGSRIQQLRKEQKLNQQQLGDRADLDRTYVSALENGKQNVTVGALARIAEALDIRLEDLLSG